MKTHKLLILLIFLPVYSFSQQLSGVWIGKLSNDSLTVRKDQTYELALTEYKGKVYGYSYTTFIVDDTLYYVVKRVKGVIKGDYCEVVDDDIVSNNFYKKIDKGVKVTQKFRMSRADSTWHIDGDWETNATKKYYALTGNISLKQEKDFDKSRLLQHLGDLNLDNTLSFYKPEKKVYLAAPPKTKAVKENNDIAKSNATLKTKNNIPTVSVENPAIAEVQSREAETHLNKPDASVVSLDNNTQKKIPDASINSKNGIPAVTIENPAIAEVENRKAITNVNKPDASAVTKVSNDQTKIVGSEIKKKNDLPDIKAENTALASNQTKPASPDSSANTNATVQPWQERKKHIIETVNYKSDSLVLSLYDNGEIDGDTVSVFVNGKMVIERQGLKAVAIKKTIYLPANESEEVEILLFAENLGSLPPNTGLLIIKDGDDRYEVRFSADYDMSPAILLKRNKNLIPKAADK